LPCRSSVPFCFSKSHRDKLRQRLVPDFLLKKPVIENSPLSPRRDTTAAGSERVVSG
jgi:hypothetical protein